MHSAHIDRFEGPTEARSLVSIFPLSCRGRDPGWSGITSFNDGRLGTPDSDGNGWFVFLSISDQKRPVPEIGKK